MKYKFDHDYHIHSYLSVCSSDPEQNNDLILQYAKDNGLSRICLTNHYWDDEVLNRPDWYKPQNFAHLQLAKPFPQADGIKFGFGCESELDKNLTLSVPQSRYNDFDFIIVPTTHLHTSCNISDEDIKSNSAKARLWVERLDYVLSLSLPFKKVGIPHLACKLINEHSRPDYLQTLSLLPNDEMERLFSKAASLGVGIELNQTDMSYADSEADVVLRPFRIAKSCGCKFYLGSDAHHPATFLKTAEVFERAISALDLKETDKFCLNL